FWLQNVGGDNAMAVGFGGCVAGVDATSDLFSNDLFPQRVSSNFGGRGAEMVGPAISWEKICFVVPTPPHTDHVEGIRALGGTVFTSAGNVDLARRVGGGKIEVVKDKLTLGTGRNRIEIYLMKGGLHADEMLFAYLPEHRMVFEGDLSDYVLEA